MTLTASSELASAMWPSRRLDPEMNRRILGRMDWAHTGPRLRALGFDFAIRCSEPKVGRYLQELFGAFAAQGAPLHAYSLLDRRERSDERYELFRDGEHVVTTGYASTALRHLLWDVNRSVVEATPDLLLIHASAAEHQGRALLFPAPSGSGKTTLVARLVRAGLGYLTDETVAIDPVGLDVRPYPRPLAIDTGSWEVLADLRPDLEPDLEPFARGTWYVAPETIRPGAVGPACQPAFIVAPQYERGGRSELSVMRRAEAMLVLAEGSFNMTRFGAREAMQVLASVVRRCRCYRLVVADLDEACELVRGLLVASDGGGEGRV